MLLQTHIPSIVAIRCGAASTATLMSPRCCSSPMPLSPEAHGARGRVNISIEM